MAISCMSLSKKMKSLRSHRATLSVFTRSYKVEINSRYHTKLPMSDKVDPSSLGHEKSKVTLGLQIPRLWSCPRQLSSQKNKADLQTDIPQQLENLDQDLHYFIPRFFRHRHLREGTQVWCRVVALACFQLREEVRLHSGESSR